MSLHQGRCLSEISGQGSALSRNHPRKLWISLGSSTEPDLQGIESMTLLMRRTKNRHVLAISVATLLMSVACSPVLAKADPYVPFKTSGRVIKNHDGDTIKLQTADRGLLTIRFSGSDTPETGQAFWKRSRNTLRAMLANRETSVFCYKNDRHQRDVCHVSVGTTDVGLEMVRQGMAWYGYQFGHELSSEQRRSYIDAEQQARAQGLGLWSMPDPQPPWECRKLRKQGLHCR